MKKQLPIPGLGRLRRWTGPVGWLVLAFLLSAGQLSGGVSPFALAAVAAAGGRQPGPFPRAGTAPGAGAVKGFKPGQRGVAAAILIFAADTALYDTGLYRKKWFRPGCGAAFFLLVQSLYLLGRNVQTWLLALLCAAVCAGAVWLLTGEHRRWGILCGLALSCLPVTAFSFSLGRAMLICLLLLGSRGATVSQGAALGGCLGLLADLSGGEPAVFYTLLLGCGGAAAAALCRAPRLLAGLAAAGVITGAAAAFGSEAPLAAAWEAGVAAMLFRLTPRRFLKEPPGGEETRAVRPAPYARPAAALRALYDSFFRGTEPPAAENPSVLFNRAADRVCRNCVLREDCWQSHYTDTYNAFNDACPQLLRRGRAEPEDFPLHFATRCVHFPALLAAIDRETHDYLLRRQYRQRLEHAQRQAREQYACLSELLDGAQPAAQAASWQPIGYRVSSTLRPREGNRLCGDQVDVFEVGASVYLLLCDGMGSGEEAHREAALTVRLLRQFLEAGIQPAPALKTLNTAMALRGQQGGGYSTIDLAELQREESVVSLFKYGAAPSYLKRGGTVRRICATDPPAGLSDTALPPDRLNLTVQAGDYLVLVSDGIADEKSDEWLLNLLAGWSGNGPDALTRLILSESRSRKGLVDDCAVVVLELPRGGENRKFPV